MITQTLARPVGVALAASGYTGDTLANAAADDLTLVTGTYVVVVVVACGSGASGFVGSSAAGGEAAIGGTSLAGSTAGSAWVRHIAKVSVAWGGAFTVLDAAGDRAPQPSAVHLRRFAKHATVGAGAECAVPLAARIIGPACRSLRRVVILEPPADPAALQIRSEYLKAFRPTHPAFARDMSPIEASRYRLYWERHAPMQVTPGVARIDWYRISGRTGRLERSRVIYDSYGRQWYRLDFTDHMRPESHSTPHLHEYIYGPGYSPYKKERFDIEGWLQ